jgi:hypothetical protein
MTKVYMVHEEDGRYSDWRYNVIGIFSSYDEARKCLDGVTVPYDTGWNSIIPEWGNQDEDTITLRLRSKDGKFFQFYHDGKPMFEDEYPYASFFITEYELDSPLRFNFANGDFAFGE